MERKEETIRRAYEAFNARDIDAVLSLLHPDVDWPNGMEGGRVHGHHDVREYWTRQWRVLDPSVVPLDIHLDEQGRVVVAVHQQVWDLEGKVLVDQRIHHVYEFDGELVKRMEIEP